MRDPARNPAVHVLLRHKRLVVLFWLVIAVAGMAATAKVSSRLSPQFILPGQPA